MCGEIKYEFTGTLTSLSLAQIMGLDPERANQSSGHVVEQLSLSINVDVFRTNWITFNLPSVWYIPWVKLMPCRESLQVNLL